MQTLDLPGIVAEVREREARLSTPGRAPDDAEPVSSPLCWLEWADNLDERRVPTLAKLCKTTPQVDLLCSICMKKHTSRCRDCGARYCSENCQKQDWKRHKMVCKAFNNWDYSTRPSDDHFLGLVFPTDRKKPELLWCRLTDNATNLETTHPDIHRLRHLSPKGHAIQVNSSVALGRVYLGHGLALLDVYALTENEKDSLLNMNQVFAFEANDAAEPTKGIDVVPRDWRHATDYILTSKHNPSLAVTDIRPVQMSTRLNNTESLLVKQIHHIEEPIQNVFAPISYFPHGGPCASAFQLGLPWRTRYILGSELQSSSDNMKYLAPYLGRRPRPGAPGTFEWTTFNHHHSGSIIIMAVGKNRIVHSHHVLALNKYLDFALKRCIAPSKKGFMKYWDKYAAIRNHHEELSAIASPYHFLPLREDLTIYPGDSNQYRSAMMNLLGHFLSKNFTMQVREVDGEFVPATEVVAPFDALGNFEFTDEERDAPGGAFAPFGTALRGTREEEVQESR